jgi:hypothetical protein
MVVLHIKILDNFINLFFSCICILRHRWEVLLYREVFFYYIYCFSFCIYFLDSALCGSSFTFFQMISQLFQQYLLNFHLWPSNLRCHLYHPLISYVLGSVWTFSSISLSIPALALYCFIVCFSVL